MLRQIADSNLSKARRNVYDLPQVEANCAIDFNQSRFGFYNNDVPMRL